MCISYQNGSLISRMPCRDAGHSFLSQRGPAVPSWCRNGTASSVGTNRPGRAGFMRRGPNNLPRPPLTIPPRMRYTKLYKMQCGGVPRAGAFCREPGQVKAGRGAPGVVAPAGIPVPLRVRRRSRACRAGSVSGQAVSRFRFAPVTGRSSGFCAQNQFGWYRDL